MNINRHLKQFILIAAIFAVHAAAQAAGTSVTIAVTGDIKDRATAKMVSDVIVADASVQAVLLVGDTYNGSGATLEKYQTLYAGTYDRLWDRLFPCPGNHDVNKELKPLYAAYTAFWKEKAHAPGMYYSFDLGGWHFISLDSVSFNDEKNVAANPQLQWLKNDLAARPGVPVVAFWHYPLFSTASHGGSKKMKPFWDAIYAHGPALVFGGHNHVYERFEPLDPDGKKCAPSRGIHQFVIGPGGAKARGIKQADGKSPSTVVFHGDAQHVGFFTLAPDGGYQFAIKAVDKDGNVSEADTGTGSLKEKTK